MTGEFIIGTLGVVLMVVLAIVLSKPKSREMSGAEKMAYESERGKLIAHEEFGNRRRW